MRETLRTRMGWLHGWVGFLCGLCLLCIFVTGTLTVFDTEITLWMQPEIRVRTYTPPTETALHAAAQLLRDQQARGIQSFLNLPSRRSPTLQVLHFNGHEFTGDVLDPHSGARIPTRETAGGKFFYDFHYTLRSADMGGVRIVDILTLALLVAAGSGVVIHLRALLPDLVMLRLSVSPIRSWLDAHLLAGVLFLPFIIMCSYTGILVHADRLFPWQPAVGHHHHGGKGGRQGHGPSTPATTLLPVPPLTPLLATARENLQGRECGFILFAPDRLTISASDASGPYLSRDHVDFSLPDGHPLGTTLNRGEIASTMQLMRGLHYARFAPPGLRWLYFISGLSATAVMATGLVLFLMKRRRKSGHLMAFRVAEGLTITTVSGLPLGVLAFLWGNRLLPPALSGRDGWEIAIFFTVWGLCLLHGAARSLSGHAPSGWREELGGIVVLGCGLPLLDILTAPGAWMTCPGIHAGVAAISLLAAFTALYARRRIAGDRA
ncbi:PepSY-associated TM helix domain-containing protein [Komagataeibacter kakiaceti JCM 25156]